MGPPMKWSFHSLLNCFNGREMGSVPATGEHLVVRPSVSLSQRQAAHCKTDGFTAYRAPWFYGGLGGLTRMCFFPTGVH
eukprot:scaffold98516_cov17-Prasinocladus_malaysianus.AAC.1